MKTADFDYHLPPELIAQHPADRRDDSRMMVVNRSTGTWEHRQFRDLPTYLRAGDVVVVNNTKVIPARLRGHKPVTGGKVEVFLLEEIGDQRWHVLLRVSKRPKPGEQILLCPPGKPDGDIQLIATMIEDGEQGRAILKFETDRSMLAWAAEIGDTPLPPYIKREGASADEDHERYQTVYASQPGAVAAPTAGLHFTPEMFEALAGMGVSRAELTLHVGIGTFRPVTAENVTEHRMDEERYLVTAEAAATINAARHAGGRCLAVGSTSVRTLESVMARHGEIRADEGRTDLFIYPPFHFRATDLILTNFHLPQSTLLMMMSAFAGRELMLAAYAEAVKERYRFFSYGDCMLIMG